MCKCVCMYFYLNKFVTFFFPVFLCILLLPVFPRWIKMFTVRAVGESGPTSYGGITCAPVPITSCRDDATAFTAAAAAAAAALYWRQRCAFDSGVDRWSHKWPSRERFARGETASAPKQQRRRAPASGELTREFIIGRPYVWWASDWNRAAYYCTILDRISLQIRHVLFVYRRRRYPRDARLRRVGE